MTVKKQLIISMSFFTIIPVVLLGVILGFTVADKVDSIEKAAHDEGAVV